MSTLFSKPSLLCVAVALLLAFAPRRDTRKLSSRNEDVTFQFGIQGQLWGDWTQERTGSQGYQQNFYLYLRRLRIIVGGDIVKDISFFRGDRRSQAGYPA